MSSLGQKGPHYYPNFGNLSNAIDTCFVIFLAKVRESLEVCTSPFF